MPSPEELKQIEEAHDAYLLEQAKELDRQYQEAFGPADAYDHDLRAFVAAARRLVDAADPSLIMGAMFELETALEQFELWLEEDDDPRSMGWVDDKGRP